MKRLFLLAMLPCITLLASEAGEWNVARDSQFEVYAHGSEGTARSALLWFEQFRGFFDEHGLVSSRPNERVLRIVGFGSEKEYEEYRLRPIADAAFVSNEAGDFILMANLDSRAFAVAAHEYAHYALHAAGLKPPAWLDEGLAEYYSTLKINGAEYQLGGDLPARLHSLKRGRWVPLTDLFDMPIPNTRKEAEMFYAESWALVDMLATSPRYSAGLRDFICQLGSGSKANQALEKVYGEPIAELEKRVRGWAGQTRVSRGEMFPPTSLEAVRSSALSDRQTEALTARVSLASGHIERARSEYEQLAREEPEDPDYPAELGSIALRTGDKFSALKNWEAALRNGTHDADLCYRYALLLEEVGLEQAKQRAALEQAVALKPEFDDARYKLALLQMQAGEYGPAAENLGLMRVPAGGRRFAYWIARATALTEVDRRDEAVHAAQEAQMAATNADDREAAQRVGYAAATDLTVQLETDSQGQTRMVTARVPHGTKDWNPFIQPSDRIVRATGELSEVLCAAGALTGFKLKTASGSVTVAVPDPTHVLMKNSPSEFYCGPVAQKTVVADFAVVKSAGVSTNLLRGMTFQ